MIDQVVSTLRDGGFKTQRAYPGTPAPTITEVVAAVQLIETDSDENKTVVEIKLMGPQHLGAEACEDAAYTVVELMKDIEVSSVVGPATFDGRSGLFCVTCVATKQKAARKYLDLPFRIGAVEQSRVVEFTAQQILDESGTDLQQMPWQVRLEQFFRNGFGEDQNPSGSVFTITNGEEIYVNCRWTSCKRITELDGTRQIREGTAECRTYL